MVATGFVTREPQPTDRRATLVSLTDRAAATLAEMDRSHHEIAGLLFGGMSRPQFDAFRDGLRQVSSRLREALEDAPSGHE